MYTSISKYLLVESKIINLKHSQTVLTINYVFSYNNIQLQVDIIIIIIILYIIYFYICLIILPFLMKMRCIMINFLALMRHGLSSNL